LRDHDAAAILCGAPMEKPAPVGRQDMGNIGAGVVTPRHNGAPAASNTALVHNILIQDRMMLTGSRHRFKCDCCV